MVRIHRESDALEAFLQSIDPMEAKDSRTVFKNSLLFYLGFLDEVI